MRKTIAVCTVFLMIAAVSLAREPDVVPRDPFLSPLRKKREGTIKPGLGKTGPDEAAYEEYIEPLDITIQGVAWGPKKSHVIVDGKVYSEGDAIKMYSGDDEAGEVNARIVKIDNGVVSIFYKGNMYEKKIEKKNNGEGL